MSFQSCSTSRVFTYNTHQNVAQASYLQQMRTHPCEFGDVFTNLQRYQMLSASEEFERVRASIHERRPVIEVPANAISHSYPAADTSVRSTSLRGSPLTPFPSHVRGASSMTPPWLRNRSWTIHHRCAGSTPVSCVKREHSAQSIPVFSRVHYKTYSCAMFEWSTVQSTDEIL